MNRTFWLIGVMFAGTRIGDDVLLVIDLITRWHEWRIVRTQKYVFFSSVRKGFCCCIGRKTALVVTFACGPLGIIMHSDGMADVLKSKGLSLKLGKTFRSLSADFCLMSKSSFGPRSRKRVANLTRLPPQWTASTVKQMVRIFLRALTKTSSPGAETEAVLTLAIRHGRPTISQWHTAHLSSAPLVEPSRRQSSHRSIDQSIKWLHASRPTIEVFNQKKVLRLYPEL